MTADYIILRKSEATGSGGERCLLLLMDVGTDWLTAYPANRRDAETTFHAIAQHAGRSKVQYAHIDGAPELIEACTKHGIAFEKSAPYVHETNGLIESLNRVEIFGGRCCLEQAGAPVCFWPYALRHFAFSRNIQPVADRGVPYERRFKEPFIGLSIPFMARIRFKQQPNIEKSVEVHKLEPSMVWGVFMGYAQNPGGKWNKRYYCAALTEFDHMDFRVGCKVRVQEVFEVWFDPNEPIVFPLKALYDEAHATIEGIRAPRGVTQAAPIQGLAQPPDEAEPPVGGTVGGSVVDDRSMHAHASSSSSASSNPNAPSGLSSPTGNTVHQCSPKRCSSVASDGCN